MARNRAVWDVAAQKYVRESDELAAASGSSSSLAPAELAVLRPLLAPHPSVVHLQYGHGLDDLDLARLRPGGHLFLYDAHPAACLWTWDPQVPALRTDLSYFGGTRVNDSFPSSAAPDLDAVEWQWTLSDAVNAVVDAGLEIRRLGEYPEPFWRPDGGHAAAWRGSLPNCFSVLARRPPA